MRRLTAARYATKWGKIEKNLIQSGCSRRAAHAAIAQAYGYSARHVYNVVTPGAMATARARARNYARRTGYRPTRPTKRSQEAIARRAAYNTRYVRTMRPRAMKKYLQTLLDRQESFELADLGEIIYSTSGIRPAQETIGKKLRPYIEAGAIEEYELGRYQAVSTSQLRLK